MAASWADVTMVQSGVGEIAVNIAASTKGVRSQILIISGSTLTLMVLVYMPTVPLSPSLATMFILVIVSAVLPAVMVPTPPVRLTVATWWRQRVLR